ncbi:hypothetical protein CYMTET_38858 [Cymbomonas tetramitiformis]|uniref:Uncharacterized protein n=1 Tax=Cymbomonas tetramitiformis TaxID=36881 RepID=A0AAE0CDD7_9CHLO|nr:hypothetical protein CYMTET_38858 [Cymbomonas tetramitiformis]
MLYRTHERLRQNNCFSQSNLPDRQAISNEGSVPSFVRCRVCTAVINKGSLGEFFDVDNYAFVRGDTSRLMCTDGFLPFPELFMTYPSARQQREDVSFLVVLPFHITRESHQDRLLETYKSFTGPVLTRGVSGAGGHPAL